MLTRRMMMTGTAALGLTPTWAASDPLKDIETKSGGRLGVAVLDTASGKTLRHRADERFAMCSTFKLLLAAAIYARIDTDKEQASRIIRYGKSDLVTWSPVTEKHLEEGLTVEALCRAILQVSDNTAANLLLNQIGGPAAWTAFARRIGDSTSRLDRMETALNSAIPGDPRDTTTPDAMLENMRKLLLGDVLSMRSRQFLIDTMVSSIPGGQRLKAGLPKDWRVAHKTGSGDNSTRNDIATLYPPGRKPVLACVYLTQATIPDPEKEAVIADVGRMIAAL